MQTVPPDCWLEDVFGKEKMEQVRAFTVSQGVPLFVPDIQDAPSVSSGDTKGKKKEHRHSIQRTALDNRAGGKRGTVICCVLPPPKTGGLPDRLEGFHDVDVSGNSKSKAPCGLQWSDLAPKNVGPFTVALDSPNQKISVSNLDNLWEFAGVRKKDLESSDGSGTPCKAYFQRRENGLKREKVRCRFKGLEKRNAENPFVYFPWKGARLSMVEARKEVYCSLYCRHILASPVYTDLLKLVTEGTNVRIIGHHARDFSEKGLERLFVDTSITFGHEMVLCGLLTDTRPWESPLQELCQRVGVQPTVLTVTFPAPPHDVSRGKRKRTPNTIIVKRTTNPVTRSVFLLSELNKRRVEAFKMLISTSKVNDFVLGKGSLLPPAALRDILLGIYQMRPPVPCMDTDTGCKRIVTSPHDPVLEKCPKSLEPGRGSGCDSCICIRKKICLCHACLERDI